MGLSEFAPLLSVLALLQGPFVEAPPYAREGDRVEQEFWSQRLRLDQFSQVLKSFITQDRPTLLPQLQQAPPPPAVSGYQVLPRIQILELTTFFDDIMSAPRQGNVQAEHFKLILAALNR